MRIYRLLAISFLFLCIAIMPVSHAGIFSGLAKLGKAAKKADIDAPTGLRHLELPKAHGNLKAQELIPNSSGGWDMRLENGSLATMESLVASGNTFDDIAFVIRSIDVPKDASSFDSIPAMVPIYISGRNNALYQLSGAQRRSLRYKNVELELNESMSIGNGIYHLERPLFTHKTRYINLTNKSGANLQSTVYSSKVGIENVNAAHFLDQLEQIKHQRLVLSGTIENGFLMSSSSTRSGISLQRLRNIAKQNDLNLVILESSKPKSVLGALIKKDNAALSGDALLSNTTGDFFNRMSYGDQSTPLQLMSAPDGLSQVAMQFRPDQKIKADSVVNNNSIGLNVLNLLVKSVEISRPGQLREQELSRRKNLEQRHISMSLLYACVSFISGTLVYSASQQIWQWLWPPIPLNARTNAFTNFVANAIRQILFFAVFLPVAGMLCFITAVIRFIWRILDFLLVRPIRWILHKSGI